jgi:hypothetical protein
MVLPVNIDSTYADSGTDASVALHQQHHDTIHAGVNSLADVFAITNYGASTGASDNTTAVQAAINAANSNGGGIVYVPAGTFICTGRLSIPGGVSAGQVAITIQGCAPQGIGMSNIEASDPTTGSVLDLRYSDSGASGKIIALYEGIFGLKDVRIGCNDSTKDDTPLVFLTMPQPRFEAVTFFGNTTHRLTSCVQDAVVLGGTGTSHAENSTSSPFSGYGGFVRECSFWAIRKHVVMQNWVDGVTVEGNITDRLSCGSSETNSAPYVIDPGANDGTHFALGNVFQNNTIEVEQYNYAFRFKNGAKYNVVRGNGIWDPGAGTLGLAYVEESTGCTSNWLRFDGYSHSSYQSIGGVTLGAGSNMIEKLGTQSPTTLYEYKPAGWQMFFNGNTNGNQSLVYDSGVDGPLLTGNNGVGIKSGGRNQKIGIYACSGSPEGVVTAAPGSVCGNVAGGASTSLYVKESGTGNTGWVAYGAPGSGSVSDTAYDATTWDGVTGIAPSKNAVRDKIESILDGQAFTGAITVPDDAYDATTWNGSTEVPTKNAVRDKIETLSGGGSLTSSSNYLSSDVTMTTAGTYYDGPTLTLAAGTWLLIGAVELVASTTATRQFTAKLWDGTTIVSTSAPKTQGTAQVAEEPIPLFGLVTPASSTTYKISATSTVNADTIRASSFKGSYLIAVKIA